MISKAPLKSVTDDYCKGKMYKRRTDDRVWEKVLASRIVESEGKSFNLELKQNGGGKFIKVTEVSEYGREFRIFLALSSVTEFQDKLSAFAECCSSSADSVTDGMRWMGHGNRVHHLSLKEFSEGRYIRVTQIVKQSLVEVGMR